MAFFALFFISCFLAFVAGEVPSDTVIGAFGPLASFQPVDGWIYPINQSVPIHLSLGNSSLALCLPPPPSSQVIMGVDGSDFGFQMTYGISKTEKPGTYIQMDSIMVPQYTQLFNFTGNLLSNKFWWNVSTAPLDAGSYLLTTSASFFACSDGSSDRIPPPPSSPSPSPPGARLFLFFVSTLTEQSGRMFSGKIILRWGREARSRRIRLGIRLCRGILVRLRQGCMIVLLLGMRRDGSRSD